MKKRLHELDCRRFRKKERGKQKKQKRKRSKNPEHVTKLLAQRSGHDQFSRLQLAELRVMAGTMDEIELSDLSETNKRVAYRWVLRGLSPAIALKKVEATITIGKNATKAYFEKLRSENRLSKKPK